MDGNILKSKIAPFPYPEISVAKYLLDKIKQLDDNKVVMV
jgi:hypothetical protein